jgi:glycolate oxidase FAD binding subunit
MRDALGAIVGFVHVLDGDKARPWAVQGVAPKTVVFPRSADEAAAVLARATAEGWSVEPAGAGTRLDSGRPPRSLDIVLSSNRMITVAEYEPADLTISVGAGCEFETLQYGVSRNRQVVGLDPPLRSGATVGGIVARADAGPLRLAHGTPRDHVLGLQFVTGDGRVLDVGGRVVKNVAGYDLTKLVVGSRGTLGLVTRVNLRLLPLPASDVTLVFAASLDELLHWIGAVREARLPIASLELLSQSLAARVVREPGWTVLMRLRGNSEAVEDATARADALAKGRCMLLNETAAAQNWHRLAQAETSAALSVRLAQPMSDLRATMRIARDLSGAPEEEMLLAAHAGDGVVRLFVDHAKIVGTSSDTRAWGERIARARTALAAHNGSVVVARAPIDIARFVPPWGEVQSATLTIMQQLKTVFDPAGIMAPSRFVV